MLKNKNSIWSVAAKTTLALSIILMLATILNIGQGGYIYAIVVILILLTVTQILFIKIFGEKYLNLRSMGIIFIILNLVAVAVWPISSNDFFSYIYQSRIWSIHHLNPYLVSYSQIAQDQFYPLIANQWSGLIAPYGPLFIIVAGAISWLGANSLVAVFIILKLFFVTLNISNAFLLYKITNDKKAFYWYAFNPFILWEFAINGHNDVMMITLLLLAVWLFIKNTEKSDHQSIFFISLSILTKFITAILFPPMLIALIKRKSGIRARIKIVLSSGIIFLATAAVCYLPFISGWGALWAPLAKQSQTEGSSSLLILIAKTMAIIGGSNAPQEIGNIFGRTIFLLFYVWVLVKIIKTKGNVGPKLIAYFCWILAALYLTCFTWLMPWYFTSLIALSIIAAQLLKNNNYLILAQITTFYGIGYYILLR